MVDLQSTPVKELLDYTGAPKVPLRLKFVNSKFSVSVKNSSGISAAAKLCVSVQPRRKG